MFKPGQSVFQGATKLCLCEECKNDYGSCDLFHDYTLSVREVSVPYLHRKNAVLEAEEDWQQVDDQCDHYWDFLSIDSVVAVAPDSGSQDLFWLIRIIEINYVLLPGQRYLEGHFLERMHSDKNSIR